VERPALDPRPRSLSARLALGPARRAHERALRPRDGLRGRACRPSLALGIAMGGRAARPGPTPPARDRHPSRLFLLPGPLGDRAGRRLPPPGRARDVGALLVVLHGGGLARCPGSLGLPRSPRGAPARAAEARRHASAGAGPLLPRPDRPLRRLTAPH